MYMSLKIFLDFNCVFHYTRLNSPEMFTYFFKSDCFAEFVAGLHQPDCQQFVPLSCNFDTTLPVPLLQDECH